MERNCGRNVAEQGWSWEQAKSAAPTNILLFSLHVTGINRSWERGTRSYDTIRYDKRV